MKDDAAAREAAEDKLYRAIAELIQSAVACGGPPATWRAGDVEFHACEEGVVIYGIRPQRHRR